MWLLHCVIAIDLEPPLSDVFHKHGDISETVQDGNIIAMDD